MIVLDGAMGTQLEALGIPTDTALWSALANDTHPDVVAAIHRAYADAGATVHTANTFRTKRRQAGDRWEALARRAIGLCRAAIPHVGLPVPATSGMPAGSPERSTTALSPMGIGPEGPTRCPRVAGSIAPLEDCWRPDLSPADPRPEHREMARLLAEGCDLLLCETFAHVGEALVACEEAVATGVETWVSFTAGYDATLLTPDALEQGAREAVRRGAAAVLVNCVPADRTLAYVERLASLDVPFGAYANAVGVDPEAYAILADQWARAGASVIGGCCGTGPEHVRILSWRARTRL